MPLDEAKKPAGTPGTAAPIPVDDFARMDEAFWQKLVSINQIGPYRCLKAAAPHLKATKGAVVNVASTAAFMPGPLMAVYYATKAYVLSLSEATNEELRGTGVTVTALCPGPTESGFQSAAAMDDSKLVKGRTIMSAATVAKIGVAGMAKGNTRAHSK